jgi:hypothetical protein
MIQSDNMTSSSWSSIRNAVEKKKKKKKKSCFFCDEPQHSSDSEEDFSENVSVNPKKSNGRQIDAVSFFLRIRLFIHTLQFLFFRKKKKKVVAVYFFVCVQSSLENLLQSLSYRFRAFRRNRRTVQLSNHSTHTHTLLRSAQIVLYGVLRYINRRKCGIMWILH